MQTAQPSPWWRPESHADRRPFLLVRNRIKAAFRAWFEARDFLEVETAADAPGSRIVGAPPILVEACDVVAVAEGWDGFLAAPRL